MAWFKRKQPPTPEELLAQGRTASVAGGEPTPVESSSPVPGEFRLTVEDVFTITGRGTVATGRVAAGTVAVGHTVRLLRDGVEMGTLTVAAVEMFRRKLDSAVAGENVGLLFRGTDRSQLKSGDVLSG